MLLHSYKITRTLPCLAVLMKIRVIVKVSEEIQEVFPYLNALLKGCIYKHPVKTLTIRKNQKLITLHALNSTFAKIEDESEAEEFLKRIQIELYRRSKKNINQGGVKLTSKEEIFLKWL